MRVRKDLLETMAYQAALQGWPRWAALCTSSDGTKKGTCRFAQPAQIGVQNWLVREEAQVRRA